MTTDKAVHARPEARIVTLEDAGSLLASFREILT